MEQEAYKAAGACLAAARKRAGVSQEELALRLKKSQGAISLYETGHRQVEVLELMLIAEALGVDAGALFAAMQAAVQSFMARKGKKRR